MPSYYVVLFDKTQICQTAKRALCRTICTFADNMTDQNVPNPYARIFDRNPAMSRRVTPHNNYRKTKPDHGARSNSRVPSVPSHAYAGSAKTKRKSNSPMLPVPPNAAPLLPGLLRKASTGLAETSSRPRDSPKDFGVAHRQAFKPPKAPYKSRWNSQRPLKNSSAKLTQLSTSSKVNDVDKSKSLSTSAKFVANAQGSRRPSQVHNNSRPPLQAQKRPRSSKKVADSPPKSKRSPQTLAKRRVLAPLPALSLERPTSPQEPSLNPHRWKHQVRVSTKRDAPPERASRPTETFFPLATPPQRNVTLTRNTTSPRLGRQHNVAVPRSSPGYPSEVLHRSNPRVSSDSIGAKQVAHRPSQRKRKIASAEKPGLDLSSDEDKPLAQVFGPLVRRSAKSSLETSPVNISRQPAVETLTLPSKPQPPPLPKITKNEALPCRVRIAKARNCDAPEALESAQLHSAQQKSRQNSKSHDQFQEESVRPLKKRRVAGNESDQKPFVSSDAPDHVIQAPVGLDLTQIEEPSRLRNHKNVEVSPVSITETPFEVSFEDPAVSELRSLNGSNSLYLIGESVKARRAGTPTAQRRRCLSFERRKQKLSQPVYISDPYEELMMEEALAAVNVRFANHV